MFDSKRLKAELIIRGKSYSDLADYLELSKSAVSKKVNGKTEWTLSELRAIGGLIGHEAMNEIFFA